MFRVLLISILGLILASQALSQDAHDFQEGKKQFILERYSQAIRSFEPIKAITPTNHEVRYFLGVSYYFVNELELAKEELTQCLNHQKSPSEDLCFYLAKVYHSNHEFIQAVKYYKDFLRKAEKNDERRLMVKSEILRCVTGMRILGNRNQNIVENLGENINSRRDEIVPVLSPNDPAKLYFSANKASSLEKGNSFQEPNFDIYYSYSNNGKWTGNEQIAYSINTSENEVLLDFDSTGSTMFFFRSPILTRGNVLTKNFDVDSAGQIDFRDPFNAQKGDCTPYLFNQNTLIFASRRAGGYGGLDLYWTSIQNGVWSEPQNLGKAINTEFDETSPFLSSDGRILYFSSNHPRRSMGGLDIFKSVFYDEIEKWSEPHNLEYPINSAGNDTDFRLSKDGKLAYFSSNRKSGFGGSDIYGCFFREVQRSQFLKSNPAVFWEVKEYKERSLKDLINLNVKEQEKLYKVQIVSGIEQLEELKAKFPNLKVELPSNGDKTHFTIRTYRVVQSAYLFKKDLIRQGFEDVLVSEVFE